LASYQRPEERQTVLPVEFVVGIIFFLAGVFQIMADSTA
jgi:hypothetical protein